MIFFPSKLLVKIIKIYTSSVGQLLCRHRQAPGETVKKAKCVFGIFPHTGHSFFPQRYCLRVRVHSLFLPNPALNRHSTRMITHCRVRRVNVVLIYLSWDILYKTKSKHIFTLTLICAQMICVFV